MKKTRKIKFTLGMKIASVLCCVALLSVGFASWWIVNYPTQKTESGNFVVYSISTKNITISEPTFLTDDTQDAEIVFGYPAGGTTTWLGYTSSTQDSTNGVAPEDLSATLEFSVTVDDANAQLSTFLNNIYVEFDAGNTYDAAIGSGVATPVVKYRTTTTKDSWDKDWSDADIPTATYTPSATSEAVPAKITLGDAVMGAQTVYVQVQFTFGWNYLNQEGGTQQTTNPYTYYNTQTYSDELAEGARTALSNVWGLQGNTYNVKIYTDPKGAETTAQ